jgi:excisionase family DNA binding protein
LGPSQAERRPEWLALEQASRRLGVHPSTLRRWADQGAIDFFLTPGGHRRFLAEAIESFAREHQYNRLPANRNDVLVDTAIARARQGLPSQSWWLAYDEQDREASRCLGRRLLGLILQFVARAEESNDLLVEAYSIGQEHARRGLTLGRPLNSLLQTIDFFRATLLEVAILHFLALSRAEPKEQTRLLHRIERIVGEVQSGVVELYTNGGPTCVSEQLPAGQ